MFAPPARANRLQWKVAFTIVFEFLDDVYYIELNTPLNNCHTTIYYKKSTTIEVLYTNYHILLAVVFIHEF
jgi:hypothetical protein